MKYIPRIIFYKKNICIKLSVKFSLKTSYCAKFHIFLQNGRIIIDLEYLLHQKSRIISRLCICILDTFIDKQ